MSLLARVQLQEPVETWPRLELVTEQRFWDGLMLASGEPGHETAAIYLFGYVAEILIKTAYCRFINLPVTQPTLRAFQAAQTQSLWVGGNLHNLASWARFLIDTRQNSGNPIHPVMAGVLLAHSLTLDANWREWLRYRSVTATTAELQSVFASIEWLRGHHDALWK